MDWSETWDCTHLASGRVDVPGTGHNNELIRCHRWSIDRFTYNVSQFFVHPLHNFLQHYFGLHNGDEIQVLVYPLNEGRRRCYLATNQEGVTQEHIDAAITNWKVASVFKIESITVVDGEKGRHAEQKLMELARSRGVETDTEKPIIVGERLPCVACKVFSRGFEKFVKMPPTHGHLYFSTILLTPGMSELSPKKIRSLCMRSVISPVNQPTAPPQSQGVKSNRKGNKLRARPEVTKPSSLKKVKPKERKLTKENSKLGHSPTFPLLC